MNRHLLLFGTGGHFASGSSLPDCLGMTLRTGGLNGTIQPYQIFVAEQQNDGPYEQRSKMTTNSQDEALYQKDKMFQEGKMVSTEYTKGHGDCVPNDNTNSDSAPNVDNSDGAKSSETVHIVHINPYKGETKEGEKSVRMSKADFDKNVAQLSKRSAASEELKEKVTVAKKKKNHKFQLF